MGGVQPRGTGDGDDPMLRMKSPDVRIKVHHPFPAYCRNRGVRGGPDSFVPRNPNARSRHVVMLRSLLHVLGTTYPTSPPSKPLRPSPAATHSSQHLTPSPPYPLATPPEQWPLKSQAPNPKPRSLIQQILTADTTLPHQHHARPAIRSPRPRIQPKHPQLCFFPTPPLHAPSLTRSLSNPASPH